MSIRPRWFMVLMLAVVVGSVRPAVAASITQIDPFSGAAISNINVTPFDSALGTLDSISVAILGNLTVTGTTGANLVPMGFFSVPVPYSYTIDVLQDFTGASGRFFDFSEPADFLFTGLATGTAQGFSLSTAFSYQFTINAMTDLIGFALPTMTASGAVAVPPLGGVTGDRADFLKTSSPTNTISLTQSASVVTVPVPVTSPFLINSVTSSGSLQITYNYTPKPAPEPAALALMGSGLAAIATVRWRRSRRR